VLLKADSKSVIKLMASESYESDKKYDVSSSRMLAYQQKSLAAKLCRENQWRKLRVEIFLPILFNISRGKRTTQGMPTTTTTTVKITIHRSFVFLFGVCVCACHKIRAISFKEKHIPFNSRTKIELRLA